MNANVRATTDAVVRITARASVVHAHFCRGRLSLLSGSCARPLPATLAQQLLKHRVTSSHTRTSFRLGQTSSRRPVHPCRAGHGSASHWFIFAHSPVRVFAGTGSFLRHRSFLHGERVPLRSGQRGRGRPGRSLSQRGVGGQPWARGDRERPRIESIPRSALADPCTRHAIQATALRSARMSASPNVNVERLYTSIAPPTGRSGHLLHRTGVARTPAPVEPNVNWGGC